MDGLRERRRTETRDAIAAAGLRLAARDGWAATTVEAIAREAGVSRRTFFRYFAGKDEVLFAEDERLVEDLPRAVRDADEDLPPLAAAREAARDFAAFAAERSAELPAREALIAAQPSLQALSAAKTRRIEAGVARALRERGVANPRAAIVAGAALATTRAAFETWLADGAPDDFADRVDAAFATLERERLS